MANKLILHTDRISEEQLAQVDQLLNKIVPADVPVEKYNHHIEVSWRDINKYAECVTEDDFAAVNPDYRNDMTSDGWWVYPIPKYTGYQYNYLNGGHIFQKNNNLRVFDAVYNRNAITYMVFSDSPNIEAIILRDYKRTSIDMFREFPETCPKLRKVVADLSNLQSIRYKSFASPALEEVYIGGLPNLKNAEGSCFAPAKLNKRSALEILNSIPAWNDGETHNLSLGIHTDHKNDEELQAAIALADIAQTPIEDGGKGWTLTVRWNGTETAQASMTYGMRKPPIYARVVEHELPDGTTERYLDWGHYVSFPENYEEFHSVEAAREYLGLPAEETI